MYLPSTIVSPPEVGGGRRWKGWKEGGREKERERERKEREQGRDGGRERRDTVREGGTKVNVSEQLKSGVHLTYSAYLHSACTPVPLEYGTCTREKTTVIISRDHTQLKVISCCSLAEAGTGELEEVILPLQLSYLVLQKTN